ncbi:proteasome subunit alpha [Achlya hypogyna]|uniref:Proteasome subunit alpha type n=1 Tax=Achlya hypogyna TaxID=1202772 RepID=A0A1V9Z1N0_ACHHY|nr:proteasome subunit alpha [Achlya hypogyna]
MFRNQYDTDVTVWSPQGHLHQIDYAMEAVKQGSACLGLRSSTHVVLAGIKRVNTEQLADPQKKIFAIDSHMGMAIAGLTADARSLARFMRTECLNHKFVYGSALPVARLVSDVADKKQECTQSYVRRPYGVGLLVAGVDKNGPHLFQTCPSGNYYEYNAIAIGARSQSARTYLEKHFETFPSCSKDELIKHALQGIRGCLEGDQELSASNVTIALVGQNQTFVLIEGADLQPYIDAVEVAEMAQDAPM